jgi:hypothetical protein
VAAFNLHPSTRGSELNGIGSSAIQSLDHAQTSRSSRHTERGPIARQRIRFRWAWPKSDSLIAAVLADDANPSVSRKAETLR